MGRAIGTRLVAGGHDVAIFDRDPQEAKRLADELGRSGRGSATAPGTSSAEEVAAQAPAGAKVVKAFNTTFAGTLVDGKVAGQQLDVLMAGDDEEAKRTLAQLVRDGGLNAVDAGPLRRARQLEGLGYLHITLQNSLNTEYQSAVKILTPGREGEKLT